jgi:methyl-accepting chemotaxis protein
MVSVRQVSDIMSEIAAASEEQSSGIEQINQAVVQMDEVTQQNAALVEESAAAAQSLQEQAAALARTVSIFVLARQERAEPQVLKSASRPAPPRKPAPRPARLAVANSAEWTNF